MNPAYIPIPHDIPLPLPADRALLEAVVVLTFLLHILFVNLMVGGSVLGVVAEIRGLRDRDWDRLARHIASTITVNKSLAVVLGVAPLLGLNVFYTVYFYTANALTGGAWILVVPLVTLAFLVSYLWKYSWESLERNKGLHISIGAVAAGLFLTIPFIFLTNINLMLFPERWPDVAGFVSALLLPNVLVRYLHFLAASIAVAGLFFVLWFTRRGFPVETSFEHLDRPRLRRFFFGTTLGATLVQFVVGPTLLLTLPAQGMSGWLVLVITLGVSLAIAATVLLWREAVASSSHSGRYYLAIVTLITWTVFCMGYGRHLYRENAVRDHRQWVQDKTRGFSWVSVAAAQREAAGVEPASSADLGLRTFDQICSSCHLPDRVLVGPAISEIASIYAGNPQGIIAWTRNPGRKREAFPPMPAFDLPQDRLEAVAAYLLDVGSGEGTAGAPEAEPAEGSASDRQPSEESQEPPEGGTGDDGAPPTDGSTPPTEPPPPVPPGDAEGGRSL